MKETNDSYRGSRSNVSDQESEELYLAGYELEVRYYNHVVRRILEVSHVTFEQILSK